MLRLARLRGGRSRVAVLKYSSSLVDYLEDFYSLIAYSQSVYVFECRRGRCVSYIDSIGENYIADLAASLPGLVTRECQGSCPESFALIPPPPAPVPPEPPEEWSSGDGFVVGYAGSKPVLLEYGDLFRHTLVLGSTGSGKSHTAARIAYCSWANEFTVVILDWHGEYKRMLPSDTHRIVLPTIPLAPLENPATAMDVLDAALNLTPQQSLILGYLLEAAATSSVNEARQQLQSVLHSLGANEPQLATSIASILAAARTPSGLAAAVRLLYHYTLQQGSKGGVEVLAALLRRLSQLAQGPGSKLFTIAKRDSEAGLAELDSNKINIVDLASIPDPRLRRIYSTLLLGILACIGVKHDKPVLVVVEEAQNYISNSVTVLEDAVSESRKYNIALVVVTHTPKILTPQIQANTNNLIVHRIVSPADLQSLRSLLDENSTSLLPRLPPGYAVIEAASRSVPAVVKVAKPTSEDC